MAPAKLKFNNRGPRWWIKIDFQSIVLGSVLLGFCLLSHHVILGDLGSPSLSSSRLLSVDTQKRMATDAINAHIQSKSKGDKPVDLPKAQISGIQNSGPVQFCVPYKVASAATKELYEIWENQQGSKPYTGSVIKYTIIRDPLERLWSGFWNKCLHQIEREHMQCPNFPHARQSPPTLEEFLKSAMTKEGFAKYEFNKHFIAMSSYCNLDEFGNQIYHLSSPAFNKDMSKLWKSTGVSPEVVEGYFPEGEPRKMQDYHANAAETAKENFSCEALTLALELLDKDYRHKQYFPMPTWATEKVEECAKLNVGISPMLLRKRVVES